MAKRPQHPARKDNAVSLHPLSPEQSIRGIFQIKPRLNGGMFLLAAAASACMAMLSGAAALLVYRWADLRYLPVWLGVCAAVHVGMAIVFFRHGRKLRRQAREASAAARLTLSGA